MSVTTDGLEMDTLARISMNALQKRLISVINLQTVSMLRDHSNVNVKMDGPVMVTIVILKLSVTMIRTAMIMLTAWATDKYNIGHIIWHILYGLGRTREIFAQKILLSHIILIRDI